MEDFDTKSLSDVQYTALTNFLYRLKWEALDNREELDSVWNDVDLALKQTYSQQVNINDDNGNLSNEDDPNLEKSKVQQDEFSEVFTPLIYRLFKGWVTHLNEALIPNTGDWFSIERRYSAFFDEIGISDFLPVMNNCWVKNLQVENERFGIIKKLKTAFAQCAAYGGSPAESFYDPGDQFVNLMVMPMRDFGVYPITDNWKKSNRIYRYPVNYVDLLIRKDLDQEAVSQIRPWLQFNSSDGTILTPTERSSQYQEERSPYGTVMMYEAHIPSLFLPNDQDPSQDIVEREARILFCINPRLKPNADLRSNPSANRNIIILKSNKNLSAMDISSFFATFDEVLPYQLHGKGPIIPFLIFQRLQNALISGMSRDVARETDPPVTLESGEKDIDDTPFEALEHGAVYEGIKVTPITLPGLDQRLQSFLLWDKYITELVEEGSGMNKIQTGGRPATKRSKFEVQEQIDAGGMRIAAPADLINDGILQPFMVNRVVMTQSQLEFEVEEGVQNLLGIDQTIEPLQAYEIVLQENDLFKRLLDFTALEPKYKDFYKRFKAKKDENERYKSEYQMLLAQMQSIQAQLASPVQPFIEPLNQEQFDPASIDQARQQHYQLQQEQRNSMKNALSQMTIQAKSTLLLIEDLKEIPESSLYFLYLLLIEPIKESDIIIYGAKTTLNKAMKRRGTLELLETLMKLPPEIVIEYDLKSIVNQYSTTIDLPFELVKKSEEEINRAKQQQKQMMMMAQQQQQQQQNAQQ